MHILSQKYGSSLSDHCLSVLREKNVEGSRRKLPSQTHHQPFLLEGLFHITESCLHLMHEILRPKGREVIGQRVKNECTSSDSVTPTSNGGPPRRASFLAGTWAHRCPQAAHASSCLCPFLNYQPVILASRGSGGSFVRSPALTSFSLLKVAKLTHAISIFTEGILMMKTTLVGIIKVMV